MRLHCLILGLIVTGAVCRADEVRIDDGAVLTGTLRSVGATELVLETAYAGTLTIDRARVVAFTTEEPLFTRLPSGTVFHGRIQPAESEGEARLEGLDGRLSTPYSAMVECWRESGQDPVRLAELAAVEKNRRKWNAEAGLNLAGKSGNSEEFSSAGQVRARLKGPHDEFELYGRMEQNSKNKVKTADEKIAGTRYTFFFNGLGWYIRTELEKDRFEDIQFRSTTASGLSYRLLNRETLQLKASTGLSWRYEDYISNTASGEDLGMDFELDHYWQLPARLEMENRLTYVPSVEDFSNYLAKQESSLTLPLGSGPWHLRGGVRNEYNAQPEGGRDRLDTTWYTSLVLKWSQARVL